MLMYKQLYFCGNANKTPYNNKVKNYGENESIHSQGGGDRK